ncbi:MAG: site-specific integrase [Loktanella sp.]|nr:site-specific integrase [Loktanella sp.]
MKHSFPGLKKDSTAAGTLRWRVRMEGQRNKLTQIPMGPDEPGFHEHYDAARRGEKLETKKPPRAKTGTLDAMCASFVTWMEKQVAGGKLSPLTLSGRKTGLKHARDTLDNDGDRMGSLDADLPEEAFIHIQDEFGSRTAAADTCIKALRAAYKWGSKRGYPKNSEVFDVPPIHKSGGGAISWTPEDVEKFLETYGPGTMARLWFCLAYATHSRIGDAPTMGPGNEVDYDGVRFVEWQPSKKGSAFVSIPMEEILVEELKFHEERPTYLVTSYGRPFASSGSLDNRVRKWIIAAKLCVDAKDDEGKPIYEGTGAKKIVKKQATRSQHGIRKGVAALMAESGASEFEIMASFGWTEAKTAAIYTKKFKRRGSAASASKRMAAAAAAATGRGGPRDGIRGPHPDAIVSEIKEKLEPWQPVGESNPSFQVENLAPPSEGKGVFDLFCAFSKGGYEAGAASSRRSCAD